MDLEQAFLDDIAAHPDDPSLWLIFADWLEERDDHRGELVRLWRSLLEHPRAVDFSDRHDRYEILHRAGVRIPIPRCVNSLGMEFVWIPPGPCWLGGGEEIRGNRQPNPHPAFFMGVTLVTQVQWRTVMGRNPSWFSRLGDGADRVADLTDAEIDRLPVETISWNDTREFLARLNSLAGEPDWRYRLPTGIEWETACRMPATCAEDASYCYSFPIPSNVITPEHANFDEARVGRTSPVGSYPPSRWGMYDLHGNVWEWIEKPRASVRGGAWSRERSCAMAAYTVSFTAGYRVSNLGLRAIRVPRRKRS